MKKVILFLLIGILLVTLPSCRPSTQPFGNEAEPNGGSPYSAIEIDDSVKSALGVGDNERVVRVLNLPIVYAFSNYTYDTIEAILESDYVSQAVYVVVQGDKIRGIYSFADDGRVVEMTDSSIALDSETLSVLLSDGASEQLPKGAKVLDVYYLWGEAMHQGSALYYITNKGDFVYYDYYLTSTVMEKEQTVFASAEFSALMKMIYYAMIQDTRPG